MDCDLTPRSIAFTARLALRRDRSAGPTASIGIEKEAATLFLVEDVPTRSDVSRVTAYNPSEGVVWTVIEENQTNERTNRLIFNPYRVPLVPLYQTDVVERYELDVLQIQER